MALKVTKQQSGWSQAKQRGLAIFYDQHKHPTKCPNGRPWWAITEKPAEGAAMPMPVGPLMPMDWEQLGIFAPWEPEQAYLIRNLGKAKPGATLSEYRFFIDYPQMVTDYTAAHKMYYERAVKEAAALRITPLPKYGDVLPYELRIVVGEPPKSPKVPQAALAGDDWLLGFDREENEALARLLTMGNVNIATFEQSVQSHDETAELRKELESLKTLMLASLSAAKTSGVPAHQVGKTVRRPATSPAKGSQEAKDRMAKARAGKGASMIPDGGYEDMSRAGAR